MRTFTRYEIPADGNHHDFDLSGPVLAAAPAGTDVIAFWVDARDAITPVTHRLVVAEQDTTIPDRGLHRGLADPATGRHLMEICAHPNNPPAGGTLCQVCWTWYDPNPPPPEE